MQSAFSACTIASAPCSPRDRQHVEDLAVVELHVVVGHVDLERGVALARSAPAVPAPAPRRRVAHDQVEGVVDVGAALGAARGSRCTAARSDWPFSCAAKGITVVVPPQAAERVPGVEVVGHAQRAAAIGWSRWQCASTPPGRDDAAGGVDLARAAGQAGARAARCGRRGCRCRRRRCRWRWRRGRCVPPGRRGCRSSGAPVRGAGE